MKKSVQAAENKDYIYYSLLVCVIGMVYLYTLLPGTGYTGDTAKFQFIGRLLGIPHPTGYPTYITLNYLFTTIFPFGTLAFKANLLSAVFTIISATVFFRILILLQLKKEIAFYTALSMVFTYLRLRCFPHLWQWSFLKTYPNL